MTFMIAIVTALPEELAPLLRRAKIERVTRFGGLRCHAGTLNGTPVVLMAGGDGVKRAEESVGMLLQRFDVSLLIGAGIAGGLVPALRAGDLITASEVRSPNGSVMQCQPLPGVGPVSICTVERIAGTVAAKHELAASGAQAIDTESAGWARAASMAGVPFSVVRAIFDSVDEEIPAFVAGDGSIDRAAVVRHALLHPRTIPSLLQMRERLRHCSDALANFVAHAIAAPQNRLDELLRETSRTFALCIPQLRDDLSHQVTIAYLLFRIADTFEDASHWPVADRLAALDEFCALLRNPGAEDARRLAATWYAKRPSAHAGYMKLIADIPLVMAAFTQLPLPVNTIITNHVVRSAQGMANFVAMTESGKLQLADMQQLRDYCYAVAGIVGEMLTELFLLRAPHLKNAAPFFRTRAAPFGEGLQLVNILKDSASDLAEGRTYIPQGVDRTEVLALARTDLESATEYTHALQRGGTPQGIVAFAALPVALAQATLDRLEKAGAGAKIGRPEVFRITRQVKQSVARFEPPLRRRSPGPSGFARVRSILSLTFGNES
jgi:farnesyl-diphosphate farnesyltransferase